MKTWKSICSSSGQVEPESLFIPTILFIVCSVLSIFCFYVAQFEWALWFWSLYAWLYGIIAVILLIIIIFIYIDNN